MTEKTLHTLQIEGQKHVCVTAVKEVESVTEQKISLILLDDKKLTLLGNAIKMNGFSKQNATFLADGVIFEVKYGYKKGNLLKKILK